MIKKSLAQEVRQKSDISEHRSEIWCWIFFYSTIFFKKAVFSEKTTKKLFWGRIWQFFRERRRLTLIIEVLNILLFTHFFQKCVIFWENARKPFLGPKSLLKERRRLATRMNINFFMANEVSNILSFNNLFEKSNIFGMGKKFWENMTIF